MIPNRLIRSISVILTAFADLTRKITDILKLHKSLIYYVLKVGQQIEIKKFTIFNNDILISGCFYHMGIFKSFIRFFKFS